MKKDILEKAIDVAVKEAYIGIKIFMVYFWNSNI